MTEKIPVMFMQSQSFFGSDSMIHSLIMANLDRSKYEVHVACNAGSPPSPSASLRALKSTPNLFVRPSNFGPSVHASGLRTKVASMLRAPAAMFHLAGLLMYMRKHGIAVVHGTEKPRDAFYGALLARLTGAKYFVHLHVKYEDWISPLSRWAIKHADGVIGVSDFVAKSVVTAGVRKENVFAVLNGIKADRWDHRLDGMPIREEFGIGPSTIVLGIVSRLFYWKGHTELLHALARVRESFSDFRLLIVGEDDPRGAPGRGRYSEELRELIQVLHLTENVFLVGGRTDIPNILAACDIFAMPTFEEPCAVAFLEAMAMKKPVVALDSGGTPQLIEHGKTGLLSTSGDIDELASNILSLMRSPKMREQMGDYARCRVEEYFTPRRLAVDVEQVYEKVLEESASHRLRTKGRAPGLLS